MQRVFSIFIFLTGLTLLISCQERVDVDKEKAAILEYFELNKKGLLESDVDLLVSLFSQDTVYVSIAGGEIKSFTREDMRESFEKQFEHGRYVEVSDLIEPAINISADGKTAWAYGQWKLRYVYTDSTGTEHEGRIINADLGIWEKSDDVWVERAWATTSKAVE